MELILLKVIVEISARHIHLSEREVNALFGKGYNLTPKRFLSQPGQFVCEEKVEIIGPKDSIKRVSVLGPVRNQTQVELSMTDARRVGISTVIRESGHLFGSAGCKIIGPKGFCEINEGVIIAKRHIHMTPEDAIKCGVVDKQIVAVKIGGCERNTIFGDVIIRISDKFSLACHIDTDESNAAGVKEEIFGKIITQNIF